ncbi:hypothetical protein [Natrononativus amylolyticus]|uniref:hypothetical protein n=1 Tax=Natrononativus amylolyticus TaxID=2963434 RepID=UPI0020CBFF7A|nr:hypothetical protein [Natrononativus amylolyticus]
MTTGFPGPGTWLVFGVILVPVYVMLVAWFAGEPRDTRMAALGVGYLVGLTVLLWTGMFLKTVLLDLVFF